MSRLAAIIAFRQWGLLPTKLTASQVSIVSALAPSSAATLISMIGREGVCTEVE